LKKSSLSGVTGHSMMYSIPPPQAKNYMDNTYRLIYIFSIIDIIYKEQAIYTETEIQLLFFVKPQVLYIGKS